MQFNPRSMAGSTAAIFVFVWTSACGLFADEAIKFDVPATLAVKLDGSSSGRPSVSFEKTIKVTVPVSTEIDLHSKLNIKAFRFDVFWNRIAYPVSEYSPRNRTFSNVEGSIQVETDLEHEAGGHLGIQGGLQAALTGEASLDVGKHQSTKRKFNQIAVRETLVASGTSHRGTGVFFRFHQSPQEVLDGGRELSIRFRVPVGWRSGILRVDCHATGSRQVLGQWNEAYQSSQTFVVPIFLSDDAEAQTAATELAQAEQQLRQRWRAYRSKKNQSSAAPLSTLFSLTAKPSDHKKLPKQWVHYLIQTGNDGYLSKYQSRLPGPIADQAERFVTSRRLFLGLRR